MYWPFLVLPYQRSPGKWKTLVSRFTHTMPGAGGAGAGLPTEEAGGVGAAAAGGGPALAGTPLPGTGVLAGVGGGVAGPALANGASLAITLAERPARARSSTVA